ARRHRRVPSRPVRRRVGRLRAPPMSTPASPMSWIVLLVSAVGGVIGFFSWLNVFHASFSESDPIALVAAGLFDGGGVALVCAALGLSYVWPAWWWRWPLMLCWWFVVGLIADAESLRRLALLPLIGLPLLAAKIGERVRGRGVVPLT